MGGVTWQGVVRRVPHDKVHSEPGLVRLAQNILCIVDAKAPRGRVESPAKSNVGESKIRHLLHVARPFGSWRGVQPVPGTDADAWFFASLAPADRRSCR